MIVQVLERLNLFEEKEANWILVRLKEVDTGIRTSFKVLLVFWVILSNEQSIVPEKKIHSKKVPLQSLFQSPKKPQTSVPSIQDTSLQTLENAIKIIKTLKNT